MDEVLHYLELKNQYLEKFHSLTERFLDQARQDRWEDLELFVDNRERILNIIHSYDYKIAQRFSKLNLDPESIKACRSTVKSLLDLRESLAKKIVVLDLELMTKIDEMKTDTIRELKKNLQTSHQIQSFETSDKNSLKTRKEA